MKEKSLDMFCRQIRSRSAENKKAIEIMYSNHLFASIISVLRQELDSLIRVIFLLSIEDLNYRSKLIELSIKGKPWFNNNTRKRITDRDMVELSNKLYGWVKYVYKFGCAFIHLSNLHDYMARDPINAITLDERKDIFSYLESYHGGNLKDKSKFSDIIVYLPKVFDKINSNLEYYLKSLEEMEKPKLFSDSKNL